MLGIKEGTLFGFKGIRREPQPPKKEKSVYSRFYRDPKNWDPDLESYPYTEVVNGAIPINTFN